jgi:hypothetical protein
MTKDFRLYLMDRFSGHIVEVRELVATDELKAIQEAQVEEWRGAIELWDRERKVMRRDALN